MGGRWCSGHNCGGAGVAVTTSTTVGGAGVAVTTSGTQSRQPGFESSCCRFEALAISFIPRCHGSLSCINGYLATDIGGYLNEYSSRSNISVAECFPKRSGWRWNEQVCQVVKCKAL